MSNFKLSAVAAFVGAMSVASPHGAEAQTIERTNIQVDGVFVPSLIVTSNGVRTIHLLGENGLTRSMLFDSAAAAAFVGGQLGVTVDENNFFDNSDFREETPSQVDAQALAQALGQAAAAEEAAAAEPGPDLKEPDQGVCTECPGL
jgi:hypothetical protein